MMGKLGRWIAYTEEHRFKEDEETKWFGIWREGTDFKNTFLWLIETPQFERLMMESRNRSGHVRTFPKLVTFVGVTGAGKSTIIRGLISARRRNSVDDLVGPVTVSSNSRSFESTTGEVNIYADPATFETEAPILYVDCEGLDGTEPKAARYQNQWSSKESRYREYLIKNNAPITDRAKAAKDIYPRFLYIFSDVICMVVRQSQAVSKAVEELLKWSQIGAGQIVNQYALPSAIIILNAWKPSEESETDDGQSTSATEKFFKDMENALTSNAYLQDLAQKNKVSTLKELIDLHYSAFHVRCINDVATGDPNEVIDSFGQLTNQIVTDSEAMLFRHAFEHLASGKHKAFNLSLYRQRVTLPSSAADFMSKFLILNLGEAVDVNFDLTAQLIAESLAIEALNPELVAIPSAVFSEELKVTLHKAIGIFLDQNLRCSFVGPNRELCVNTRKGHIRGHQNHSSEVIGTGGFDCGGLTAIEFINKIEAKIRDVIREVNTKQAHERRAWVARAHAETLRLAPRPRIFSAALGAPATTTKVPFNVPCFGCLLRKPEHRLPCNHILCGTCIERFQDYSHPQSCPHIAVHSSCLLCGSDDPKEQWPVCIRLQPPLSGVRILSLDGGGVRGIVELATLKRLQNTVGLGIPIAEFFDLIVGSNTGGFIAIGLGIHGWSIEQAIQNFDTLFENGLERSKGPGLFWSWFGFGPETVYKSANLEAELQRIFDTKPFFGLPLNPASGGLGHVARVAVTVSREQQSLLLANYSYGDDQVYVDSRRSIWEASRATSAAPYYFAPYRGPSDRGDLFDGGLYHNNPIDVAISEKKKLWSENTPADIVLSVGSGNNLAFDKKPNVSTKHTDTWVNDLTANYFRSMNGQEIWSEFMRGTDDRLRKHSFRLNPDLHGLDCELYDGSKLRDLEAHVEKYPFQSDNSNSDGNHGGTFLEIATALKASLFYWDLWEIDHSKIGKAVSIKGAIICRLDAKSGGTENADPGNQPPIVRLLADVKGFHAECSGKSYNLAKLEFDANKELYIHEVEFQIEENKEPSISIMVEFAQNGNEKDIKGPKVHLSGSPFTLEQLRRHAATHLQSEPVETKTGLVHNYKRWTSPQGGEFKK